MTITIIILRLVHIFGGVFFAGSTFFLAWFIAPTAFALGFEGGRFMERLMMLSRFSSAMAISGGLAVLSGIILYVIDARAGGPTFAGSSMGITLAVGGLCAVFSLFTGTATGKAGQRLGALMNDAAPPAVATPEQTAAMESARATIERTQLASVVLLVIAVAAMAIARYL